MKSLFLIFLKRYGRRVIGLLASVAVGGLLVYGSRDRLLLLDRATRIADVHGWGLERPDIDLPPRFYGLMPGSAQYQWIGQEKILFFHDLKPIHATITQTGSSKNLSFDWPASVGTPALYRVSTHSEQPLPRLAALYHKSAGKAASMQVSPDGTHLLWKDDRDTVHLAGIEGTQPIAVKDEYDASLEWCPDNKLFYGYGWSMDTKGENVIVVNRWEAESGDYQDERTYAQPANYDLLGDCALTPHGDLATNDLHLPRQRLNLYLITPGPKSVVHTFSPALPADTTIKALVYSPGGDRLAWAMTRDYLPPVQAMLHRLIPAYKPGVQRRTSLWVSSANGENLHEIGHIPIREGGRQFYKIDYVRWLPDGKTLSFVSDDILYTVPIE